MAGHVAGTRRPGAAPMSGFALVAHADWSGDRANSGAKRQVAIARRDGRRWVAEPPRPVGEPMALVAAMLGECAGRAGRAGLLALDFPIGLPIAYARRELGRHASFPEFLDAADPARDDFFRIAATLEECSAARPFFPAGSASGKGVKAAFLARIGLDAGTLLRACDRKGPGVAAACGIFWTLGANQVGKAALAGWRELVWPCRRRGWNVGLWPFDGTLDALGRSRALTIAECYPAEGYSRMRFARAPAARSGNGGHAPTGKRTQAWRRFHADTIRRFATANRIHLAPPLLDAITDGFGTAASGEDAFDAVIGLFATIEVAAGRRGEGPIERPAITSWEGWMLGRADYPG